MSTYHLRTAQANILPGTYGLSVTATQTGYSSFTATIPITVNPSQTQPPPGVDTLRTITELLTIIWRDGQAARQLTAQDCRDTVLTLALQTGDFSRLPRSSDGLSNGRAWLDSTGVIRVNLVSVSSFTPEFSGEFS